MGTDITTNYVNRAYVEPYRTPYSKDPPQAEKGMQRPQDERFADAAARADLRAYDGKDTSHREEMMRVMDPQAYREYQQIKKTTGSTGNPTESMRFMMSWIEDKAVKDPAMERRFGKQKDALEALKERFGNADFKVAGAGKRDGRESDAEFTVTLTKDELHTLAYGTEEEKEALYKQIDDAFHAITEAEKELDEKIPGFDFGIDTKADAAERFFAIFNGETLRAGSTDSLFEQLMKQVTGEEPPAAQEEAEA